MINFQPYPGIQFMPELEDTYSNRWLTALLVDESKSRVSKEMILKALEETEY